MIERIPAINTRLLRDQTWRMLATGRAWPDARVPHSQRPRRSDRHRRNHFQHARQYGWIFAACWCLAWACAKESCWIWWRRAVFRAHYAGRRKRPCLWLRPARAGSRADWITTQGTPSRWATGAFAFRSVAARRTKWARTCGWCWRWRALLHDVGHSICENRIIATANILSATAKFRGCAAGGAIWLRRWCAIIIPGLSRRWTTILRLAGWRAARRRGC